VPILGVTWIFRERRLRASVVIIPLIPAALVVALATGSRGPIVALIFTALLGLIALLTKPHAVSWRLVGLVGAVTLASVVVAAAVAPEFPGQSIQRFAGFMDFLDGGLSGNSGAAAADTSAGQRVTLYRLAGSMFQERPILGAGTSGFQALSPQLVGAAQADAYPHNALLQFAAEFGIVGLALFASLALLALTRPLPRGPDRSAVRVLLAFFVLNAMFSGDILQDRTLWGLLLLILMIGPRRGDEATNALRSDRSLVPGRERIDK
jgi:O-antigen ligase